MPANPQQKIEAAVKLARECSRDSWKHAKDAKQAREFRRISRECIGDARSWKLVS